jgi:hypothetical protein
MMDAVAALERHIERQRRFNSSPEAVYRSAKLFLDLLERKVDGKAAERELERVLAKLEARGVEGKAAAAELRLELLESMVEQLTLNPEARRGAPVIETLDDALGTAGR